MTQLAGTTPSALARIAFVLLFGIAVGAAASLLALLFVEAVNLLNDALLVSPRSRMIVGESAWLTLATIAVPTVGGLLVGLIMRYVSEGRPLGVADTVHAVQSLESDLPGRSGLLTALASIISLGCGASVGVYGPLAHMGATIGSVMARLRGNSQVVGAIGIACGVAAAISTAFNAPIAGIVFAHEVVLRHYSLRAFAPVTVASTMGFVLGSIVFEHQPLFRIVKAAAIDWADIPAFALVGVGGALVAIGFMKATLHAADVANRLHLPQWTKPMLAGALLGVAAIWIPDILGIGRETLRFAIIPDAFTTGELVLTLVAKTLATALCIGLGFAGGVFSPALVIGTLFGALAGIGSVELGIASQASHAIYAVCGMVAVTSPVIGAPLTSILIVFELTRNYELTTAVMVAVVFSNVVAYRVFGRSLFDVQLAKRGVDLSLGRDKMILSSRTINEYVSGNFTALEFGTTLGQARERMLAQGNTEAYVTARGGHYVGTLRLSDVVELDLRDETPTREAAAYARPEPLVFTSTTTIWQAMDSMCGFVGESIPVVRSTEDPVLIGVVFESAVVSAYMNLLRRIRSEEHGSV
jgi:CIC family chloride channel protein